MYNGVSHVGYDRGKKRWIARLQIEGKVYRKYFENEIDAAKWYDEQCRKYDRLSKLNFPTPQERKEMR